MSKRFYRFCQEYYTIKIRSIFNWLLASIVFVSTIDINSKIYFQLAVALNSFHYNQ